MKYKGVTVYLRDTDEGPGTATGAIRHCTLEGCLGVRICVKWPNGKKTFPCSKGLKEHKGGLKIQ